MKDKDKDRVSVSVESSINNGISAGINNGIIYNGMNYTEVRALCIDLIKDEINKSTDIAKIKAEQRYDEFFGKFIEILAKENIQPKDIIDTMEEPSSQIDFNEASKAYIKFGTATLCDMLSELLARRIQEKKYSLLQITLGEAIKTAPLLLPTQYATLALAFILKHTRIIGITSDADLSAYFNKNVVPVYENGVSTKQSEFQHLSYARCGTISIGASDLISNIREQYSGLFSKGFSTADMGDCATMLDKYPSLFVQCLNDASKYQFNAIDKDTMDESMKNLSVPDEMQSKIHILCSNHKMNNDETRSKIIRIAPKMEGIINYFTNSLLQNLQLSSVGIVLGAFYATSITKSEYDLSIWI